MCRAGKHYVYSQHKKIADVRTATKKQPQRTCQMRIYRLTGSYAAVLKHLKETNAKRLKQLAQIITAPSRLHNKLPSKLHSKEGPSAARTVSLDSRAGSRASYNNSNSIDCSMLLLWLHAHATSVQRLQAA